MFLFRRPKNGKKEEKDPMATTAIGEDTVETAAHSVKTKNKKTRRPRKHKEHGSVETCIGSTREASARSSTRKTVTGKANQEKRELVRGFVKSTLKKGVNGLIQEFRKMKRLNDLSRMVEFVKQNETGRNRYKDVGCLDGSRVTLSLGPVPYIHANYVATPNNPKKFICTQAPLTKTCAEFWYMIVQEKSSIILMLCNFFEMGTCKCANYFPQQVDTSLEFGDGQIKVTAKAQEDFKFTLDTKVKIVVKTLEVTISGQPTHTCFHYHWQDWPDRGVPAADLAPIFLLNHLRDKDSQNPIVVHCSAGIGRTGSIVLLEHVMELLHNGQPLMDICVYMIELRKQRNNSVQTEQQYLYVHQVLLIYLKRFGYLESSVQPMLDVFTKDYLKATTGF